MSLLEAEGVSHNFRGRTRPAVSELDLRLDDGGVVALVGESGSGKSTMGRILAGLLTPSEGTVRFNGRELTDMSRQERRVFRRSVQIVQQDPFASLNPSLPLRTTLGYAVKRYGIADRRGLDDYLLQLLARVGLEASEDFLHRYPHQLSGGQRQRVAIARAVSLDPAVIVADEAVSMLDVSMRVALLDLMLKVRGDTGAAFLFISHDFGVVRYFAKGGRIVVMFGGVAVETGATDDVIGNPRHPYTYLLLQEIPVADPRLVRSRRAGRSLLLGEGIGDRGCVFAPRCPYADERCRAERPPDVDLGNGHAAACWYPERVPAPEHAPVPAVEARPR